MNKCCESVTEVFGSNVFNDSVIQYLDLAKEIVKAAYEEFTV